MYGKILDIERTVELLAHFTIGGYKIGNRII